MSAGLSHALSAVREHKLAWAATVVGFVVAYYLGLLVAALVRFRELPNYIHLFDWPDNIGRILDGTPSLVDAWSIIGEEWIIDIGRMNYDYGTGVAEWAVTVITAKFVAILLLGLLVATAVVLVLQGAAEANPGNSGKSEVAAIVLGTVLVGIGNATLHWAVACATPSWVASLAMLGMSPALANWLEPEGDYITVAGFLVLSLSIPLLARRYSPHCQSVTPGEPGHA